MNCSAGQTRLEDLIFSDSELPSDCKLKTVLSTEDLPCKAESNPFISSDLEFISCFVGSFISNSSLIPKVKRALFSIYMDQAETGIFAIETESKSDSKLFYDHMKSSYDSAYLREFFYHDQLFIWLWRDKGKNENFDIFKKLIKNRIV